MMYKDYVRHRVTSRAVANGDCLEYRAGKLKHRYGLVSVTIDGKRKSVPAHRALWMAMHDCFDLPSDVYICHTCDNPCCVNMAHLFMGAPKDNAQDMITKGRGRRAETYKKHTRKRVHSDAVVASIREATGKHKHIAEEHGVSVGYVSKIKAYRLKAV